MARRLVSRGAEADETQYCERQLKGRDQEKVARYQQFAARKLKTVGLNNLTILIVSSGHRRNGHSRHMESESRRLVRGSSAFRDANNRIRDAALRLRFEDDQRVPFVCECSDVHCMATVMLTLAVYAMIRADPRRFVLIVGHENPAYEAIVDDRGKHGYLVVEKFGIAGDAAAQLAANSGRGQQGA